MIIAKEHFLLAQDISKILNLPINFPTINIFPSGEIEVSFNNQLLSETVIFIDELATDPNNTLIINLLIIDALKHSGVREIIYIVTYLPYLRFDKMKTNTSFGSKFIADLLNKSGISKLVILEPHFLQINGYFDIFTENIICNQLFIEDIKTRFIKENFIMISPDIGRYKNVLSISEELNVSISCANKCRNATGEILKLEFYDDVKDKICIIIDDIVDTGNTLFKLASILQNKGAKKIIAYITHGIFSQNSLEHLNSSFIDKIFVTDSVQHFYTHPKIHKITIAGIISDYIKKSWKF